MTASSIARRFTVSPGSVLARLASARGLAMMSSARISHVVPLPSHVLLSVRHEREPVGRPVAGVLGAEGEESQIPFMWKVSLSFLATLVGCVGLSYGSLRIMRGRRTNYKLAKLYYQFGRKGQAASLFHQEALELGRSLPLKGAFNRYDDVEESFKAVDMAVTALLEAQCLSEAKQVLDLWKVGLTKLMHLEETDRMCVILETRYGDLHSALEQFDDAQQCYGRALVNAQKLRWQDPCGATEAILGSVLEKIGRFQMHFRKFAEAKVFFERALQQASLVFPETDRQVISLYNSLATACDNLADHDRGIEAGRHGLELAERAGVHALEVGALHYNLGMLYMHKGDLHGSRRQLEKALLVAQEYEAEDQVNYCHQALAVITRQEEGQPKEAESTSGGGWSLW